MSGNYNMKVNNASKELTVNVEGNFTEAQAIQFVNDYKKHIASIIPSTYSLRIDSRNLNVVTPELIPALEQCFTLYKSSGFKDVIIEIKENATLRMQIGRIARRVGLEYTIEAK